MPTWADKLDRLRGLVAYHEMLWNNLPWAADQDVAARARPWVDESWAPWLARWNVAQGVRIGDPDDPALASLVSDAARGLTALRQQAYSIGIPVPNIGSSRLGFIRRGRDEVFTSGEPGATVIDEARRSAWDAARASLAQQIDPSLGGGSIRAIAVLQWSGKQWVVPFGQMSGATAYFDRARKFGIDYDYGARFDTSDPTNPFLAWEQLGNTGGTETLTTSGDIMSDLIGRDIHGRHGGGHGGGGFHGGGYRGHGRGFARRRGGLRRNFSGGWDGWWPYGWPMAFYPAQDSVYDAYYDEEEDDDVISGHRHLSPADDQQAQQQRPDPVASPGNELFALLPVIAPGANGLSCQMNLGPDMQLRVSICVDNRCYQSSVDMSEMLGRIAQGVADAHAMGPQDPPQGQGPYGGPAGTPPGAPGAPDPAVQDVAAQADEAVQSAGLMLVGALYDQHVSTVSSGWFDSLGSGVLSVYRKASSPVTWINKQVAKGLLKFKGPVTMAATMVATAYGGPAAGAAAAKLVGPILESSAKTGGDPTKLFDDVKKSSGNDPQVVKALVDAQQAVAHTTAAYHLTDTAAQAVGGDKTSQGKIAELEAAASSGDKAAASAMKIIAEAFNAMSKNDAAKNGELTGPLTRSDLGPILSDPTDPPAPSSDPMPPEATITTSGADIGTRRRAREALDTMRRDGMAAALAVREQVGSPVIGFIRYANASAAPRHDHTVVIQDTTWVGPLDSSDLADDWLARVDMSDVLYAAYYDASDPTWPHPINDRMGHPAIVVSRPVQTSGALTSLGGEGRHRRNDGGVIDAMRREGRAAAIAMRQQYGSTVIGYMKTTGSGSAPNHHNATVVVDTTWVGPFTTSDEADDWMGRLMADDVVYAAYYDASDPTWPHPLNEKIGQAGLVASRQAPTTSGALGILPWLAFGAAGGGAYAWWRHHQAAKVAAAAAAKSTDPTTTSGVPLLALAAAGAGGWFGRGMWQAHRDRLAAEALAATQAADHASAMASAANEAAAVAVNAVNASSSAPAIAAPATTSGWW